MKYKIDFHTEYNQFYIQDKLSDRSALGNIWTQEAYEDRMAEAQGIIAVGTECYGDIRGELNILDKARVDFNSDDDHIVESSLEIKSGRLQILGCPINNLALEVTLSPNTYRVRVYSCNLDSVDGDDGEDYYKIEIWPEGKRERQVLKRYVGD